jgi:hypothetical protein
LKALNKTQAADWTCYNGVENNRVSSPMNLDIQSTIRVLAILALAGVVYVFISAIRTFQVSSKLFFYKKRRQIQSMGWRKIFLAFALGILAIVLNVYAEPAVYQYFPPSATMTLTSTITLTPTITETPTRTLPPTITETPSVSPTPFLPAAIISQFTSEVTPDPGVTFSPIQFARQITESGGVISTSNPLELFTNPINQIYGVFNYISMIPGVQWTALWYRFDGEIVCSESIPWNGSFGGFGYTECNPSPSVWLEGEYEVQIYVGTIWVQSGRFSVTGTPPPVVPTAVPTLTRTSTRTATATLLPTETWTVTPIPSITPTRSSPSPRPTDTRWPSATP